MLRLAPIDDELNSLSDAFDTNGLDGWDWATAGIIVVASIAIAMAVRWGVATVLCRRMERGLAVLLARLLSYVAAVIGLAYALGVLGVRIGPLLGALGIAGIALAFALKDILENFVAGVMLQLHRPFVFGDEIEINDRQGRVEDIDARLVTLVTPQGETLLVPSATVIKSEVVNYTAQRGRRTDLPIGVAYGTDLKFAHATLLQAVEGADGVRGDPAPTVLLTGFGDSSIDFVVRYWHDASIAAFWQTRHNVAFAVESALADADITIPFPQRTLWLAENSNS